MEAETSLSKWSDIKGGWNFSMSTLFVIFDSVASSGYHGTVDALDGDHIFLLDNDVWVEESALVPRDQLRSGWRWESPTGR